MSTNTDSRCQNSMPEDGLFRSRGPSRGYGTDLRCPKCGGSDLKKASLAYEEGVYRVDTKTRLRAFLFGSDGPNVIVGKEVTQGGTIHSSPGDSVRQ